MDLPLKDYVDKVMTNHWEAHAREHAMLDRNIDLAREAVDARLESMNAFRAQLASERNTFVARDRFDDSVATANTAREALEGRLQGKLDAESKSRVALAERMEIVERKTAITASQLRIYVGVASLLLTLLQIALKWVIK